MNAPQTRINYKLSIFLSICCVFMLIILLAEWQYSKYNRRQLLSEMETIPATAVQMASLPEIGVTEKTLESYEDMASRPLFLKGRRPVESEEISDTTVFSGKMELILTGVIAKPDGKIAMLQNKQKQGYLLQVDDAYNGWQVEDIKADSIIFKRDNERNELLLRKPAQESSNTLPLSKSGIPAVTPPGKQAPSKKLKTEQSKKQHQ